MDESNALSLRRGQAIEPQPIASDLQRAVRDVHSDDLGELTILEQELDQAPFATADLGSRCSITSTTAAASKSVSRESRYISEPWMSRMRSRCVAGKRSSRNRSPAISSARYATSIPTTSAN